MQQPASATGVKASPKNESSTQLSIYELILILQGQRGNYELSLQS